MLKQPFLPFLSFTFLGVTTLCCSAQASLLAQTKADQVQQQQPDMQGSIEQIFANLSASRASMTCVGRNINEDGLFRQVASYRWYYLGNGLVLSINANQDSLRYCTSLAFEELRYESFLIGLQPPTIILFYYLNDEKGMQIIDEPAIYSVSQPSEVQ